MRHRRRLEALEARRQKLEPRLELAERLAAALGSRTVPPRAAEAAAVAVLRRARATGKRPSAALLRALLACELPAGLRAELEAL